MVNLIHLFINLFTFYLLFNILIYLPPKKEYNYKNLGDYIIKCKNITSHQPKNIHDLHINNIDIVMALGDSITAGFGIKGSAGLYKEFRGRSWSIGGDYNQITIPNFIKYYNPNVKGYSVNSHIVEVCNDEYCIGKYHPEYDRYNSAQSGSTALNLIHQINYLKSQFNYSDIDKWKLITLFIGANDLCGICNDKNFQPTLFKKNLKLALQYLKSNFPKSFVNLPLIFNVSHVYELSKKTKYCTDIHRIIPSECSCAFDKKNGDKNRKIMDSDTKIYQKIMYDVAHEINTDVYDNFTIVIQPMFAMTNISKLTIDFLSTLDCFHPSLLAHQSMAISLWNNMFRHPLDKKALVEYPNLECPGNDSILYSNYQTT